MALHNNFEGSGWPVGLPSNHKILHGGGELVLSAAIYIVGCYQVPAVSSTTTSIRTYTMQLARKVDITGILPGFTVLHQSDHLLFGRSQLYRRFVHQW